METPVSASFKEKLRIEAAKLREMTFKEKMEYIWEYYRYLIIGVLIVLFIIGSLLNTWLVNPPADAALFISWNAGFVTEEQFDSLNGVLKELLINEKENKEIIISYIPVNDTDPTLVMAGLQRTVAMVAAGSIDIFILDAQLLEHNTNSGFLRPLESILEEIQAINHTVYATIKENVSYELYKIEDDVFSQRIMGIKIKDSPLLSELGFYEQELYLGVSITTGNEENVTKTLIALFD